LKAAEQKLEHCLFGVSFGRPLSHSFMGLRCFSTPSQCEHAWQAVAAQSALLRHQLAH